MGTDSFHTSHIFWTFHSKSFVNHQQKNFTEGQIKPGGPDIFDDGAHHILPQDGTVDDDDKDLVETVFVTKEKKIRVTMQHEHYVRRGSDLESLFPYEWAAMIRVEKKRQKKVSRTR